MTNSSDVNGETYATYIGRLGFPDVRAVQEFRSGLHGELVGPVSRIPAMTVKLGQEGKRRVLFRWAILIICCFFYLFS